MTWVTLCCTCNLLPHTDHCVASCALANAQLSPFAVFSSLVGCQANGANPPSDQRLSTRQVSQALERVHHHHVLPWWALPHYAALACAGVWKLKRSGLFGRATARVVMTVLGRHAQAAHDATSETFDHETYHPHDLTWQKKSNDAMQPAATVECISSMASLPRVRHVDSSTCSQDIPIAAVVGFQHAALTLRHNAQRATAGEHKLPPLTVTTEAGLDVSPCPYYCSN